jgi:hypothetical protein
MHRHNLFGAALIVSAALLPATASAASAALPDGATSVVDTTVKTTSARSVLLLTVTPTDATPPSARSVVLTCEPSGGTHPKAEPSCSQLSSTGGKITAMPFSEGRYCPKIFQPVTASAAGWWSGSRVGYQETFANSCLLELATGPLFQF